MNEEFGYEVEVVGINDVKDHPRNYREHPEDQIKHIKQSIRENGLYRNVVVAKDLTILAGHGVVQAARELGVREIPVVRLDLEPDDTRALKVLTGDNEIEHLALQDDRVLTEILKDIKEDDLDDLLGTGFDEMMLAGLAFTTRTAGELADFDEAAEWVGMPEYDPGDEIYRLGISFHSVEERIEFMKKIGVEEDDVRSYSRGKNVSLWWPLEENETVDLISVGFEDGREA